MHSEKIRGTEMSPMRLKGRFIFLIKALSVLFILTALPAYSQEDRLDKLEKEVEGLKKENEALKDRLDSVEADEEETRHGFGILSKLVEVSGYADAEFSFTDEESDNNKFRIRHLSLFFTKDIQKEWKLFTEVEFEDAPRIESNASTDAVSRSQGSLFVEQMYIEYHPKVAWDLRFGRFLTPAGIWSIYHYPPYVPTQTGPLFYKVIFPEVSDGIQLRNSFIVKDSALDTHLYLANGGGNPGRLDRNQNKALGLRVNFGLLSGLSTGASYYREKDNSDVARNGYGLHLLLNYADLRFQTEYALRHNKPEGAGSYYDKGLYALLAYDIGRWTLAGRFDWYDSNSADPKNDEFRYTGAVNYHFAHNVTGKAEYNRYLFDDPSKKDFNEFIMAIVVAIGDL